MIVDKPCTGRCDGKNEATEELHPCPYACEIDRDFESQCDCCEECEKECGENV